MNDVLAGLAFLRARSDVDPRRLVVAGHSFGGSLTLASIERDPGIRAAVIFGGAAGSWDSSPPLQSRLRAAVSRAKAHLLKIYPPVGHNAAEGHDFVYRAVSTWEPDVFAFLDEHVPR